MRGIGAGGVPTPKNLELAYEAAKTTLAHQDGELRQLRDRATWLFVSAVIAVAFAAAAIGDGRRWAGIALLVVLTLMAVAALLIHWPARDWTSGPSATTICEQHDAGRSEAEVRRYVVGELVAGLQSNHGGLRIRQHALHAVIALLWIEATLIVIAITW